METATLDHLYQSAYNAYYGISFTPERRAKDTINSYAEELNNDLATIRSAAKDTPAATMEAACIRYRQGYEKYFRAWLSSMHRIYSAMIAGPSNFPFARMEKRNEWADNHYNGFRSWRERALKAIQKGLQPVTDPLEEARKHLADCQRNQRMMVAANKIIRKGEPETRQALIHLGFAEAIVDKIYGGPAARFNGFAPFKLSNNRQEITRLQDRVKILEQKKVMAETVGVNAEVINGVELLVNYVDDRVQLKFPGKPSPEVIQRLKTRGFKWAPSVPAWQRKITRVAIDAAKELLLNLQ